MGGDEGGYRSGGSSGAHQQARVRRAAVQQAARLGASGRSRPTNNQLLYKAYFRWNHYSFKLRNGTQNLPTETDACASVTAAFLQASCRARAAATPARAPCNRAALASACV